MLRIPGFRENYRYRNQISKIRVAFKGDGSMEEKVFD